MSKDFRAPRNERKGCCGIARQRAGTASKRAARARAAGKPVAGLLASLEEVLALAVASTLLRAAGASLGTLLGGRGQAPAPVPPAAPAKAPAARPKAPGRALVPIHIAPTFEPLLPAECYTDPAAMSALQAMHRGRRRAALAKAYGDFRYPRALQILIRHAGDPRRMPRVGGKRPWDVVQACDAGLADWLDTLGHDPQKWAPLARDVKKAQREAAGAAYARTQQVRSARQEDAKAMGVEFVDDVPDAMGADVLPAARRQLRISGIEAYAYCARHVWAKRVAADLAADLAADMFAPAPATPSQDEGGTASGGRTSVLPVPTPEPPASIGSI